MVEVKYKKIKPKKKVSLNPPPSIYLKIKEKVTFDFFNYLHVIFLKKNQLFF